MAIDYTELFTQLGKCMGIVRDANSKNYAVAVTDAQSLLSEYTDNPSWAFPIAQLTSQVPYALSSPVFAASQATGITTLVETVDSSLTPALAPKTELAALQKLIADMVTEGETIEDSAVTATLAADAGNSGTGSGDESIVLSGSINRQNAYAETIQITCVTDRASGLQYSGNEVWNYSGAAAEPFWSSLWPAGSGASGTFSTCSATIGGAQNGPNKSLVIGGGFETFYSSGGGSVPTYFEAVSGAALMASSTDSMRNTYAAQVTGNGATQYSYRQKFGQTSTGNGTNPTMPQPNKRYLVGVWLKRGGATTAGVIRLSLKDTGGSVLASVSVNATDLTTSYVYHSFQYLTGDYVDPNLAVVLESTTAIATGEVIRHDELTVVEMIEAYPSGPLFAIVAGGVDYAVNDLFTLAVTNDRDGVFQQEFARLFPAVLANRLVITSGGSPTISDALVTI